MATHIRFNDDDADEYQCTDSDDELTENDKELLKKARTKRPAYSDSEDEVFGVGASESEQSDIALSDVEGQGEDDDFGIPDPKAWGKKKHSYYSTDYVDPDYGGFQGKDTTLAELEEEEARNLQAELAKHMDDDDFSLDILGKSTETKAGGVEQEEVIKTDVSQLSKRQKLQLLQKESPEFFGLVEDYETKMKIVQESLFPIITLWREKKVEDSKAMEFVNTYYELILNYCTNIYMYLLLKANKTSIQNHPIIKRLYQYRQLFIQMDPVYIEVIKPQLDLLISQLSAKYVPQEVTSKRKKTLKVLSKLSKDANAHTTAKKMKYSEPEDATHLKKKKKSDQIIAINDGASVNNSPVANESNLQVDSGDSSEESPDEKQEEIVEGKQGEEVGKRGITYQIAKNKGLMPHRKKEQRNPRVKHRNKFRKANIRRKGAVREVRRELSKYGGEISGIKSTVSKSIKIK